MEKLIEFLKNNLRENIDPEVYANAVLDELYGTGSDFFEIHGFDTKDGIPITNHLSDFDIILEHPKVDDKS